MSLESVYKSLWYRGQMSKLESVPRSNAAFGNLATTDESVRYFCSDACRSLGFEQGLYRHQAEVVDAWSEGKDVFLSADAGCGRRTTVLLLAIGNIVLTGSASLLIMPDERLAERIHETAKILCSTLLLDLIVLPRFCRTREDFEAVIQVGAGLVMTTAKVCFDAVQSATDGKTLAGWLRDVGYCGVHGGTLFAPAELSHLRLLLQLIRSYAKSPRFVLSGLRMDSPEHFASSLFGRADEVEVISQETSEKSEYQLAMWFPALKANPTKLSSDYSVKRAYYLDEAVRLTANVWTELDVCVGAVWNCLGLKDKTTERRIADDVSQLVIGQPVGEGQSNVQLSHWNSPEDSRSGCSRNLDFLVLLGLPGNIDGVRNQIANLLRDGGLALIVIPDDPIVFSQFRRQMLQEYAPSRQMFSVPASNFLERHYLNMLLRLGAGKEFRDEDIYRLCPRTDILATLLENKLIVQVSDGGWLASGSQLPEVVEWGQIESDVLRFELGQGSPSIGIGTYLLPFVIHQGASVYLNDGVFKADTSIRTLQPAGEDHPVATIPDIEIKLSSSKVVKKKSVSFGGKTQSIEYVSCTIEPLEKGYYALADIGDSDPGYVLHSPSIEHASRQTFALMLESSVSSETASLLWLYLRMLYRHCDEMLTVVPQEQRVAVIALSPAFSSVLGDFYERFDLHYRRFLEFSYTILEGCPCKAGCSRCLFPVFRRHRSAGSKESIMRFLADMLDRETFVLDWAYKSVGLATDEAQARYELERNHLLRLFDDRFDLHIKTVVPVKAVDSLEPNIAGTYASSGIEVVAPMQESVAIKVISHEYAHNWEFDPGGANMSPLLTSGDIPHDGKLVSEGFAQWVSFKICDHLSLIDEAKTIKLWVDDEYCEGFDFLNWLEEDIGGFSGVIEFVTKGSVTDQRGKLRSFDDLYQEFLARV